MTKGLWVKTSNCHGRLPFCDSVTLWLDQSLSPVSRAVCLVESHSSHLVPRLYLPPPHPSLCLCLSLLLTPARSVTLVSSVFFLSDFCSLFSVCCSDFSSAASWPVFSVLGFSPGLALVFRAEVTFGLLCAESRRLHFHSLISSVSSCSYWSWTLFLNLTPASLENCMLVLPWPFTSTRQKP